MILRVTKCGWKKKKDGYYPPDELYLSERIRKFINFCKESSLDWAILSAEHGLFFPDENHGYYDTTLLLFWPNSIRRAIRMGFKQVIPIFKGSALLKRGVGWFIDEPYPKVKLKQCLAHNFRQPIFRCRGSLSATINTALILGAKEIRLIGIELDKLQDFYFDVDRWAKDDIERDIINRKLEMHNSGMKKKLESRPYMYSDFDERTMHTTAMPYKDKDRWGNRELRGMIDILWWMNNELVELGHNGIYSTIDYKGNRLRIKEIMEE